MILKGILLRQRLEYWQVVIGLCTAFLAGAFELPASGRAEETASQPLTEIRIELSFRTHPPQDLQGWVRLHPEDGTGQEIRLPVTLGKKLSAQVPAGKAWEVTAEVAGYWAPVRILNPPPANQVAKGRLDLWPTGRIKGSVKMRDRGVAYPKDFSVSLESPPAMATRQGTIQALVRCPLDERGTWSCDVPAGVLDLKFRANGFIPRYRWGTLIPAGGKLSLKEIELRRGASLSGWVEVRAGQILPGQCMARLVRLQGPGAGNSQDEQRLRRPVAEKIVARDGFFQLEGIAPGAYQLEVQQPGYATARVLPLEVWEFLETSLKQPVLLRQPLTIELSLSPPLDWLGRPWKVVVQRRSDFSAGVEGDPAFQGPASQEGTVRIARQAAGRFSVQVEDSLGNNFLDERDLEIPDADSARQTLEIALQDVRGRVTLGDKPLAATLWFGGRFGLRNVKLESDEEGKFQGVLPSGGTWKVEIAATEPKLKAHLKVQVREEAGKVAALDLSLPDTKVFGRVVDESGRGIVAAQVDAADATDTVSILTEDEGRFELRSVPEGNVEISARAGSREEKQTSDPLILTVSEANPAGPLTLVLRRTKEFRAKVQSPHGDVPGAFIRLSPLRPPQGSAAQARTGIDGFFSAQVDARAEAVVAVVSPPGNALKAFSAPVSQEPVNLDVSPEGGALDVALPFKLRESDREVLIFQNGLPLPVPTLLQWTEGHGQRFETAEGFHVSAVAPGEYEVCVGPPIVIGEGLEARRQEGHCASGSLSGTSTLHLDLTKK